MCGTEGWVIYSCFGGTHTSPVAAGLHLGLLRPGRPFTLEALDGLPPFDRLTLRDLGRLRVWGRDAHGLRVATVGHGGRLGPIRAAVVSTLMAAGASPEQIHWVDCYDLLTPSLRLGGFLSRRLGVSRAGRILLLRGLEQIRGPLEARVQRVLEQSASRPRGEMARVRPEREWIRPAGMLYSSSGSGPTGRQGGGARAGSTAGSDRRATERGEVDPLQPDGPPEGGARS